MYEGACVCGRRFRFSDQMLGQTIACPSCRATLVIPVVRPDSGPSGPAKTVFGRAGWPRPARWTSPLSLAAKRRVLPAIGATAIVVVVLAVGYHVAGPDRPADRLSQAVRTAAEHAAAVVGADQDGDVRRIVRDYEARYANDPASVQFIEWRPAVPIDSSPSGVACDTAIAATVRANVLGHPVVHVNIYYIRNKKVVQKSELVLQSTNLAFELNRLYGDPLPPDPVAEQLKRWGAPGPPRGPAHPMRWCGETPHLTNESAVAVVGARRG
ncbi:MAG: hypothetical protein IRY99_09290 [Isosphaeraceae bacterium]|nr:hypothetical protein [Isosphaeraceae bacterium]